tara:strand:- start:3669 stop:3866 length:198 start_codon:yes stop_codon:yes gene_type:complete
MEEAFGMVIEIKRRGSWGNILYDPVNQTAKLMVSIQGGKTLSKATLDTAEKLGFEIKFKTETWGE